MRKAARAIVFKDNQLLVMKRNKFGAQYCTLPGGAVGIGETPEQALRREVEEETGIKIGTARAVFIEVAGDPFGTQYVYLCDYLGGDPTLSPNSIEAKINQLGKNLYEPAWLSTEELQAVNFMSPKLKQAIIDSVKIGFPQQPRELA